MKRIFSNYRATLIRKSKVSNNNGTSTETVFLKKKLVSLMNFEHREEDFFLVLSWHAPLIKKYKTFLLPTVFQ